MTTKRTNWTDETFKKRIHELYDDIEVIGEYVNSSTPISVKCTICNNVWNPTANNLIRGNSHCPICSKKKKGEARRISQQDFERRVHEKNPYIKLLGKYTINRDKIECYCQKCENKWSPTAGSLLQGIGCPICAKQVIGIKKRTSHDDFVSKLFKINPTIEVLGRYGGAYTPIECKCKICNSLWMAIPHNILTRSGCPNCSHTATSFIEQFILMSLREILGNEYVLTRDKKAIGKELDIYIPSLKVAIEPGAWYYHKNSSKNDKMKRQLCREKGIRLITIYYGCEKDDFEAEDILRYKTNFTNANEFDGLIELVKEIFLLLEIKCHYSSEMWQKLKVQAYLASRKTSTSDFAKRLHKISSQIMLLGEYRSTEEKIKCQCKTCNHIWEPTPHMLLQGSGCPVCSKTQKAVNQRTPNEVFVQKLRTENPNIIPLEPYVDSKTKIKFKCKKCGEIWDTKPAILLRGHGCPTCAGRPRINTSIFKERMASVNANIEILGEYVNTSTKILCICRICNHKWEVTPHDLQRGRGCPECGRKRKGVRKNK